MKTSAAGVAFICAEEGCRLEAYQDIVGVWTIGYGHTERVGSGRVFDGMHVTQSQAEALLKIDLARFEAAVSKAVRPALHQCEFDACVSLAFNVGAAAFAGSTLVRALNDGEFGAAAGQFTMWTKAGGVHNPALLRRRTRELLMFVGYGRLP